MNNFNIVKGEKTMKKSKLWISGITTALVLTTSVPLAFSAATNSSQTVSVDTKMIAEQYLKSHAKQYGWQVDLSDLSYLTTVETPTGSYVRFQQTLQGAPVFTNVINVTVNKAGQATLIVSDFVKVTNVEQHKRQMTKQEAENQAVQHLNPKSQTKWANTSSQFGYYIENGTALPSYRVVTHLENPFGAWETYVHAGSGKLLKKKDLNQHVNGTGKVFFSNPVETQGSITGLADNRDADSTALTNLTQSVTLQGLDGSGYLKGSYVTISSKAKTYSSTNTFNFTRNHDSFEDVNVYYHLDTLQRYIQSLGFININNRSITANVNGTTQDNSFYSPSTKALTFGTGGVDDAEDAGIIAHEYGHSIQDNQVPGFGNSAQGGAMGEGFGDYLGATYEDATSTNPYGTACVGEWDAISYSSGNPPCLRRLDKNKVYPADYVGQVHADGEIWSQGLYEMYKQFGRDVATKIILQSHFSLTPNATFNDGARAIKQADAALYGGSHAAAIDAIWSARGISTN